MSAWLCGTQLSTRVKPQQESMNFSCEQGSKYLECHVVQNYLTGLLECLQEDFLTLIIYMMLISSS